ncbi:MAG: bifunctional metallophosphatase/5'-nucleotidase [Sphaerochaetaceae bacterium]|nr:bifunctional metallophosphatase/5'-nucleotidase [Sphaerochaetaceae bacterium]
MNFSKKFFAVLLVALIAMTMVFAQSIVEVTHGEMYGKTVVLHSNDVHGSVEGYAKMAALRDAFEAMDAEVILVDAGDFSQGTTYVSVSKGADAIAMMNAVGYTYSAIGNHEFDYGYPQLVENAAKAEFSILCSNIFDANGNPIFANYAVYETAQGAKIGFFGMDTPEAQTKANPSLIKGLTFPAGAEMYAVAQNVVDALKAEGVDTIICLAHLGIDESSEPNTSYDLLNNTTGIDFLIDGHSHSAFSTFDGKAMQQTGTAFANVGVVVLDSKTGEICDNYLQDAAEIASDEAVAAAASVIIEKVNAEYAIKFGVSEVELNGDKAPGNRNLETNNGDLITDAMMWAILKDEASISVPAENVVAITNGGGIRAWIHAGDITKKDINTVLPFGNTVAVVYVTGAELLEALEASTFCTPTSLGGFPQTAGMVITVDTTKAYDANAETYPASTYYGPASINRVTINSVNGKDFDVNATYAVITNNFCAAGGDTYYAFASASAQFDTGLPLDEVVMAYITDVLGGVVGQQYAEPQGRMTVIE